jgi:hypothetical protein
LRVSILLLFALFPVLDTASLPVDFGSFSESLGGAPTVRDFGVGRSADDPVRLRISPTGDSGRWSGSFMKLVSRAARVLVSNPG